MEEQERRLVLIEWVDSYGASATWQNLSSCEPELMVCQSVGWLVHDDERCKVIVPHILQPDHPTTSQQGCSKAWKPLRRLVPMSSRFSPFSTILRQRLLRER